MTRRKSHASVPFVSTISFAMFVLCSHAGAEELFTPCQGPPVIGGRCTDAPESMYYPDLNELPDAPPACPDAPGLVTVDLRYDFRGASQPVNAQCCPDGIIDSVELQHAVNCLDGDPFQEHSIRHLHMPHGGVSGEHEAPEQPYEEPEREYRGCLPNDVPGGELRFVPHVSYELDRSLLLPLSLSGQLVIRGNGAVLRIRAWHNPRVIDGIVDHPPPDWAGAVLERRTPPGSNSCDADWMGDAAHMPGLTIERLTIQDARSLGVDPTLWPDSLVKGVTMHGSYGLNIRDCVFDGLDVGVDLHSAASATVERCLFRNMRTAHIVVSDAGGAHDSRQDPLALAYLADCADSLGPKGGPAVIPELYSCENNSGPSPGTVLRGNRHEILAFPPPSTGGAAHVLPHVYYFGNPGLVIAEHEMVTGARPERVVLARDPDASLVSLRDLRVAFSSAGSPGTQSVVEVSGPDSFGVRLDHVSFETDGSSTDFRLIERTVANGTTPRLTLRNSVLPQSARFSVNCATPSAAGDCPTSTNLTTFEDVLLAEAPPGTGGVDLLDGTMLAGPQQGAPCTQAGSQGWLVPPNLNRNDRLGHGQLLVISAGVSGWSLPARDGRLLAPIIYKGTPPLADDWQHIITD